jgi:type IV secretory pathway TrbL component
MDTAVERRSSGLSRSRKSGTPGRPLSEPGSIEPADNPSSPSGIDQAVLGSRCVGARLLAFASAAAAIHAANPAHEPYDAALPSSPLRPGDEP